MTTRAVETHAGEAAAIVRWAPSATWDELQEPYADAVETHISTVLFVGDRAYKVKKPVQLPFLDLSSAESRRADADAEVELNSRLSPDVYLGVAELVAPGGCAPEPVVVMRRLPRRLRLSTLVEHQADVDAALRDAARRVAHLHAGLPGIDGWDLAERMLALWEQGSDQLEPFVPEILDSCDVAEVRRLAVDYVRGRRPLFDERVARGKVLDGHGDLLADDIFCLDDGVRILDCLEFDKAMRVGDVLADAAFLVMDLERLGRPDLGDVFLNTYDELTGETYPGSLAHHYIAYRAFVRAKIACLRASGGSDTEARAARSLFGLCKEHLLAGRPRLVMLGGLPGTGKSTVAGAFAELAGETVDWVVLNSDRVRKELAYRPATEPLAAAYGEGAYSPAHTDAVYGEMLRRAARALERGVSVVLDASWSSEAHRELARQVASDASAASVEACCRVPLPVAADRLLARQGLPSPSDATPDILAEMAERFAPWPSAQHINTSGEVQHSVETFTAAATQVRPERPYMPAD